MVLDLTSAIHACQKFGNDWKVRKVLDRALVCTKGSTRWSQNCNSCETWRLVVWEDGGWDENKGWSRTYKGKTTGPFYSMSTVAGKYYGGANPCRRGDYFPLCGEWTAPSNFSLLSIYKNLRIIDFQNFVIFVQIKIWW